MGRKNSVNPMKMQERKREKPRYGNEVVFQKKKGLQKG